MHTPPAGRLLTGCALTLGLVIGCQSTDTTAPVSSRYSQAPVKTASGCVACSNSPYNTSTYATVPTVASQPTYHWDPATAPAPVASKTPTNSAHTVVSVETTAPVVQAAAPVPAVSQVAAVDQTDKVNFPRGAALVSRKSYADITAQTSFGHAPDYRWISGEAMVFHKEWRLRYASVDEADQYGGSLRLVGDAQLKDFVDGAQYKLEGRLTPDDGKGPYFLVENVEVMK